ncbi:hypothetical protein G4V62_13600 [Bacillaceae bacterium SIJ1]|uniref:hypothetical protein n=1 Tax=Litoribacterium kuwaitense TaxID=1398745 RepID=UPI0013ED663C|nr:hypothetical protein [Litoribacterium kuwaitense]NGP45930.1 hypothetical protein [Litoribacterium kuwaitense]
MSCFQEDLIKEALDVPKNFAEVASATPGDERRLMVSDNPETLTPDVLMDETATLWHDVVHTSETCVKHRIFGWHLNKMDAPIQIGVTLENKSEENAVYIQDINRQQHFRTNGWLMDVGQCLAKACLGGTLEAIRPVDDQLVENDIALVEAATVPDDHLYGFIYELTIIRGKGSGPLDYVIRTVVSQDVCADVRPITDEPIPNDLPHPRGSWPFSETIGTLSLYETGEEKLYPTCAPKALDGGPPTDALMVPEKSDVPGSKENIGQFGGVYTVQVPVFNGSEETETVEIRVNPRGGAFAGAAEIRGMVRGIPLLRPYNDTALIDLHEAPPGVSLYTFRYMTAGASSLPLAVYVRTV